MTDGTQFSQLPSFMQQAAKAYYESYVSAIDRQAELADGDLMAMAADLSGYVSDMVEYVENNADFSDLVQRFDTLSAGTKTQESIDELNELIPLINEYIAAYNALNGAEKGEIPLIQPLSAEDLEKTKENATAVQDTIAALDTATIYKDLAMAKEEANSFLSVLSKLGEGEDQFVNLHDAVMAAAQEIADSFGITDTSVIGKMGEKLLEGLLDTYPDILKYVDTATGMLTEGWEDGIAKATNPWKEFFSEAKLKDALTQAKRDMASLDASSLWEELLKPEGKGLYQYAEDWAKQLLPDGTAEEIHTHAQAFVDAFFDIYTDIDTAVMDENGRLAAGVEETVAIMRKAANAATTETTKLENAYKSLHSGTLARNEAISGLTNMKALSAAGNTAGMRSAFEALSTEAISAISDAMPALIDKLNAGTAAAEDFEAAIAKLHEAETKEGKDAWEGYFNKTEAGLRKQSALITSVMRNIITEVSGAENRQEAFYHRLMELSKEDVDVSGLLDQYGLLCTLLLEGTQDADALYAALTRMENLDTLQASLEHTDKLTKAFQTIDLGASGYDPLSALEAYETLEKEYTTLTALQRGSTEYLAQAKALVQESTAAVYQEAAAYGVVTSLQAKAAQAAATGAQKRQYAETDKNSYAGGVAFLETALRQAEASGKDIAQSWKDALSSLDEAGHLEAMCELFGDISNLAIDCGGNVAQIVAKLNEMRAAAQAITLSDTAKALREERASNTAGTNAYREQIDALSAAFDSGSVTAAMETWNSFDEALQQSIANTYPSLVIALDDANQAAQSLSDSAVTLADREDGLSDSSTDASKKLKTLGKELNSAQKASAARYFKNTATAIENLRHGTVSANEAFAAYNKEAEKAVKANEEYTAVSAKMAAGTEVASSEVENLAEYLGNMDPTALLQNWDQVGSLIASA